MLGGKGPRMPMGGRMGRGASPLSASRMGRIARQGIGRMGHSRPSNLPRMGRVNVPPPPMPNIGRGRYSGSGSVLGTLLNVGAGYLLGQSGENIGDVVSDSLGKILGLDDEQETAQPVEVEQVEQEDQANLPSRCPQCGAPVGDSPICEYCRCKLPIEE